MQWFKNRRIVVPCDFSDEAVSAIDVALEVSQSPADVHVVHVLPALHVAEPAYVWESIDEKKRVANARESLEKLLGDRTDKGLGIEVRTGDPGHVITDFAAEIGAGLIVIPSHGRTGVQRLLLGSVAERVTRLAPCPVLVLKK